MKKIFTLAILVLTALLLPDLRAFSQTAVNADGTLKTRGNVLIITNYNCYNFDSSGNPILMGDPGMMSALDQMCTALRAMSMQNFGNMAFGIVNRDDRAYEEVKTALEQYKLEDYLDGFSVQAKNQGADWIYAVECTMVSLGNVAQFFIDTRLLNVETNVGYHDHFSSKPISPDKMQNEVALMVQGLINQQKYFLYDIFPEQYCVMDSKGKELSLSPYQPNGRILKDDKFYIFDITSSELALPGGKMEKCPTLEPLGVATNPEAKADGFLHVKSNVKIEPQQKVVLVRNSPRIHLRNPGLNVSFFGLSSTDNVFDNYIRSRINNAMLSTISNNPFVGLVEQEHIPELRKERELQKTEDFLNGHTVNQMKAIGANSILHIDDYVFNGKAVSFIISIIDTEQNVIVRQVPVESNLDNLEAAIYKALSDRFAITIGGLNVKNDVITLYTPSSIPEDSPVHIEGVVSNENPITKEVTYTRIPLCDGVVIKTKGNLHEIKINKKTKSLKSVKNLMDYYNDGQLTLSLDADKFQEPSLSETELEKKYKAGEKKNKFSKFLDKVDNFSKNIEEFNNAASDVLNIKRR